MRIILLTLLQFWVSIPHQAPVLLQGNWQSCRRSDQAYEERIYEHCVNKVCKWELHMGPGDEFALYRFPGPPDAEHTHATPDNYLYPAYRIGDLETWRGKRNWGIDALKLWVSISMAGGSRNDCESFYVVVRDEAWRAK